MMHSTSCHNPQEKNQVHFIIRQLEYPLHDASMHMLVHVSCMIVWLICTLSSTANTVMVSCMDTCSSSNTTFPLCTFNNSYKRSVQRRREDQTILLKVIVNNFNSQSIPCICQSSWREKQSHPKQTECESRRDVNVDHQGSRSTAKKSK